MKMLGDLFSQESDHNPQYPHCIGSGFRGLSPLKSGEHHRTRGHAQ
jgi:hypothetical protein